MTRHRRDFPRFAKPISSISCEVVASCVLGAVEDAKDASQEAGSSDQDAGIDVR
jgi:hypothetical protein